MGGSCFLYPRPERELAAHVEGLTITENEELPRLGPRGGLQCGTKQGVLVAGMVWYQVYDNLDIDRGQSSDHLVELLQGANA